MTAKYLNHKLLISLVAGILGSSLLFGCADLRKMTYPKDFTYIGKKDLDNTMHKMSAHLARLETLIAEGKSSSASLQGEVVTELAELKKVASSINGKGEITNHRVVDDHIEGFINDIENARMFASDNPPNYYYAGKLAGSCTGCHQFR